MRQLNYLKTIIMGKRLLFVLLLVPYMVFITLVMVASVFVWMVTGSNLLYLIDWSNKKMTELL